MITGPHGHAGPCCAVAPHITKHPCLACRFAGSGIGKKLIVTADGEEKERERALLIKRVNCWGMLRGRVAEEEVPWKGRSPPPFLPSPWSPMSTSPTTNLNDYILVEHQLTTFPTARYMNNTGLYGFLLPPCGEANTTVIDPHQRSRCRHSLEIEGP
ncbi:hypothetical protein Taro_031616 [Colocasia esculenta]|uniref:Uncharacterized protein n=1 Tax=Colocasia esculenta TaxID=4460 RepID=A0A843W6Y2_COLES|nr:hypothetical protein [Colocasia esculenta]